MRAKNYDVVVINFNTMNPSFYKPFTFDRVVRLIIGAVIALAIIYALHYFKGVLLPFFIAWLLAYLIYPMVNFVRFKLRFKSHTLSVITVLVAIIGIIVTGIRFFVPMLISEFLKLKNLIFTYAQRDASGLIPQDWESFLQYTIAASNLEHLFDHKNIIEIARDLFPHAWGLLTSSFSVLVSVFLVFIVLLYLFFILKDYDKISKGFIEMIPVKQREFVSELMENVQSSMRRYYRGQATIALTVGILFCIGFSIIGLPLAILMGLLLGVLNLVPYMQVLGIPPTIILMLLRVAEDGGSPWWALISLALVYIIVQIIQDGFLVPKIMGKAMGLNPAVILLSLSIWGVLLGILGLIIALPATTLLIAYYKKFILSETDEQVSRQVDE